MKYAYTEKAGLRGHLVARNMVLFYKHHEEIDVDPKIGLDSKKFCVHRFYLSWGAN